jgi:multidrug efflux pump subunit AcrB
MDLSHITISSISLFAMITVLGMIVDDAIVVTENVYRYIEQGLPVKEAALRGAGEVFWPVVAAVATTIAAFLPMLFMTGPPGKFMSVIPKVVIFALAASLWEAFFILPSHLADFARPSSQRKPPGAGSIWFKKLQRAYTRLLRKVLKKRYAAVGLLTGTAGLILAFAIGTLDFILFPNPDFDTFYIKVEAPVSSSIEQTDRITTDAEKFLLELPSDEMLSVETNIGQKIPNLGVKEGGMEYGSNISQVEVRLTDYLDRQRSGREIMDSVRSRINTLQNPHFFKLNVILSGPPVGKPVAVRVMGDDFQTLKSISHKVMAELGNIRGVTDIEDDFSPGKDEIRIIVDEERGALFDLNVPAFT